ncbi:MAG: sel1 repeat family protein [Rickettsiales bacterium]|nr:sel1 repeat family protein [Rickettsiales bacterium]
MRLLPFFIGLTLLLTSCQYVVSPISVPAAALGMYEASGKRERWHSYAEKGDVYAQYELAESYCCRPFEGETNLQESLKWFCVAARNGYAKAQVEVGKLYEGTSELKDHSVTPDPLLAYIWFAYAARRANEEARQHRNALKETLTPEQLYEAESYLLNPSYAPCVQ